MTIDSFLFDLLVLRGMLILAETTIYSSKHLLFPSLDTKLDYISRLPCTEVWSQDQVLPSSSMSSSSGLPFFFFAVMPSRWKWPGGWMGCWNHMVKCACVPSSLYSAESPKTKDTHWTCYIEEKLIFFLFKLLHIWDLFITIVQDILNHSLIFKKRTLLNN